jgi:hypothetical protein
MAGRFVFDGSWEQLRQTGTFRWPLPSDYLPHGYPALVRILSPRCVNICFW